MLLVLLAVPLPRHGTRLLGAATALAVARVASQNSWMSKSVVLLGFDASSCKSARAPNELGAGREHLGVRDKFCSKTCRLWDEIDGASHNQVALEFSTCMEIFRRVASSAVQRTTIVV